MKDIITSLEIEKRKDGMEKIYNYYEKKSYIVDDVIGLNKKEAINKLKNFKVEFSGVGTKVVYQSPSSGEYLEEGNTIKLLLSDYDN